MSSRYAKIIAEQRELLGKPPRSFGFFQRWHWKLKAPAWCAQHAEQLLVIYESQRLLREEGVVVWGVYVQANVALFKPGPDDCPAMGIYSRDTEWGDDLTPLVDVADALFTLKDGGGRTEEESRFSSLLADELPGGMRLKVPVSLTEGRKVLSTTVMFHRKHLPGGCLTNRYFPLLIHPDTKATLMVPSRYWPGKLLADWNG